MGWGSREGPGLAGLVDVLIGGLMHLAPPYESKIASLGIDKRRFKRAPKEHA